MRTEVIYEDLGLDTLPNDADLLLRTLLNKLARDVEARMKILIGERFFDTGATKNSVVVSPGRHALERDIGPSTHYAIYGELGYHQTHSWGKKLATPVFHPGKHFARDALRATERPMKSGIRAVLSRLGRP